MMNNHLDTGLIRERESYNNQWKLIKFMAKKYILEIFLISVDSDIYRYISLKQTPETDFSSW